MTSALHELTRLSKARSRCISAENVYGGEMPDFLAYTSVKIRKIVIAGIERDLAFSVQSFCRCAAFFKIFSFACAVVFAQNRGVFRRHFVKQRGKRAAFGRG